MMAHRILFGGPFTEGGGEGVHCLLSEEPLCAGDVITQHWCINTCVCVVVVVMVGVGVEISSR